MELPCLSKQSIYFQIAVIISLLVEKRKKKKISQAVIAQKMGTSESAISRLENYLGESSEGLPRMDTICSYAKCVGYDLKINLIDRYDHELV